MLKSKRIDAVCVAVMLAAVALAATFMHGESLGLQVASRVAGYETRLFDAARVHSIDIVLDDWDAFLDAAPAEQYVPATLIIDGERFTNVGLRAKGNNSLRLTESHGLDRYSLKIEFDHYHSGSYYGLDKCSLDSSFQDNSYLKTWLAFDMMRFMDVPTPLCSWVWVTVNGEARGLFLAIEEPEEAFARRNFGSHYGQLYKPDYKRLDDENADVHLRYTGEDFTHYDNIFRNAKFAPTAADKQRVVDALRVLDSGEGLEAVIDIDEVLRYFTVQVFVVNLDSYLGKTGHNYFLHEQDGVLRIIPWDYNLAFSTYSLGMPNPINDATLYVNYPINTPASGAVMKKRPLYHHVMKHPKYFSQYHAYFDEFITGYFESGYFAEFVDDTAALIAPYVQQDPTAFCSFADHTLAVETIREFCLLRAQSVRGQLDGYIPSTIAAQEQDRSTFVDASHLWLPDMGEIADLENGETGARGAA